MHASAHKGSFFSPRLIMLRVLYIQYTLTIEYCIIHCNDQNVPSRRRIIMTRTRCRDKTDDDNEEERIIFGFRRARQATSYHNRDSSSLFPAQFMEQEVYYAASEESLFRSTHMAHLISLLVIIHTNYSTMIEQWQRLGNIMTDTILEMRDKTRMIQIGIEILLFL